MDRKKRLKTANFLPKKVGREEEQKRLEHHLTSHEMKGRKRKLKLIWLGKCSKSCCRLPFYGWICLFKSADGSRKKGRKDNITQPVTRFSVWLFHFYTSELLSLSLSFPLSLSSWWYVILFWVGLRVFRHGNESHQWSERRRLKGGKEEKMRWLKTKNEESRKKK